MSRSSAPRIAKNSVQIAKQDNYDLIAIGTLEQNKCSNEYVIDSSNQVQSMPKNQFPQPSGTPADSVITNQNHGLPSHQSNFKPDVTDRFNNSSIYQMHDSKDTVVMQDIIPDTDLKLGQSKFTPTNAKFVNIITTTGKDGNPKLETNSDQIDQNNGGEEQDQLDDLKLFDSSQMQIIYDESSANKVPRVKQNYDQIINSPKHKYKLMKRTQQLDKRKEQLEEKIKKYSKSNLIEVVINQGREVQANSQIKMARKVQPKGFNNIVFSSQKVGKKKKNFKQAMIDGKGLASLQQAHVPNLRMSPNNNQGYLLTTNETVKHKEKGYEILQQIKMMEDAQSDAKLLKDAPIISNQSELPQNIIDQANQDKVVINQETEEGQISETLKSRITPTLSHQFTLMQSLSSNPDKTTMQQQNINSAKISQNLTSGRNIENLQLEEQQQMSVEISPVKINDQKASRLSSQNASGLDNDDMVVIQNGSSKYFKQLQLTNFEASSRAQKNRPQSQAQNARKNRFMNKSMKPQEARQYLSTAQSNAMAHLKLSNNSSYKYQQQDPLSINLNDPCFAHSSFDPNNNILSPQPRTQINSYYNSTYKLSNQMKKNKTNHNLRSRMQDSQNNKELVSFFNSNLMNRGKIRKPKVQTRVSSGGGVIFSPKNDHQLQNSKIQQFLENTQRDNIQRDVKTQISNGQISPVVCSNLGGIKFQPSFKYPLTGLKGDPRKRIKNLPRNQNAYSSFIQQKNSQKLNQNLDKTQISNNQDLLRKSVMTPKSGQSRNPLCNLLISKAKDDNGGEISNSQGPVTKNDKNFICITPNNLSLDFGQSQIKRFKQQKFALDNERKAAINKYMKKYDHEKFKSKMEQEEEAIFMIEGKRSALNSPFDVSCSKQNKESIDIQLSDSQNQEIKKKFQFYEEIMVSEDKDQTLYPSKDLLKYQNSRANKLQSREHSKKSRESSVLDEKEFGTCAQGGSISFVEKDITLSKSSLNKSRIHVGSNNINDVLNIDQIKTGYVQISRGASPKNLIRIQNEQNITNIQEPNDVVKDGQNIYDDVNMTKCYLELQQQYTTEYQTSVLPIGRESNDPNQQSIFDMYNGQRKQSPLNEESLHENPLLVNSKIFSKSQQLRRNRKQESISENSRKINEDLQEVRNEKLESLQSNKSNKRSVVHSRNQTQVSMPSHPESKLSLKQRLQYEENKVVLITQEAEDKLKVKHVTLQQARDSQCSSQFSEQKVAVHMDRQNFSNGLNSGNVQTGYAGSQQFSVDYEQPSPNIIKTSTLTGTAATVVNQAVQQSSFSFMDKLGTRSFERNRNLQNEYNELDEANNAFIIEQQNFNIQMQNELQLNLIRSINSLEKVSMKVKTFECPLPDFQQQEERTDNKSQLMNRNGTHQKHRAPSNHGSKFSQEYFQKGCQRPLSTSTRHAFPLSNRKSKNHKQFFIQHIDQKVGNTNFSNQSNKGMNSNYKNQGVNRDIDQYTSHSPKSPTTFSYRHNNQYDDDFQQINHGQQQIKLYLTHNLDANGNIEGQNISLKQGSPLLPITNQRSFDKFEQVLQRPNRGDTLYAKPDAIVLSLNQQQIETDIESKRMALSDTQKVLQKDIEISNKELKRSNANIQMNDDLPYQIAQISPKHKYHIDKTQQGSPVFLEEQINEESPVTPSNHLDFEGLQEQNKQNDTISIL